MKSWFYHLGVVILPIVVAWLLMGRSLEPLAVRRAHVKATLRRQLPPLMNSNLCTNASIVRKVQHASCAAIENERSVMSRGFVLYKRFLSPEKARDIMKHVNAMDASDRYRCGCDTAIEPEICRPTQFWFYETIPDIMQSLEEILRRYVSRTSGPKPLIGETFELVSGEFSGINPWVYPFQYLNDWSGWMDSMASQWIRVWLTKMTGLPAHQGRHGWHTDGGLIHKFFLILDKEDPKHANLKLMPFDVYDMCRPRDRDAIYRSRGVWQNVDKGLHYFFDIDEIACTPELEVGDMIFFREDVYHDTQDVLKRRMALIFNVVTDNNF